MIDILKYPPKLYFSLLGFHYLMHIAVHVLLRYNLQCMTEAVHQVAALKQQLMLLFFCITCIAFARRGPLATSTSADISGIFFIEVCVL